MGKTSTKAGKGKTAAAASKKAKEIFVLCPYTEQKVWISKATVTDLQKAKPGSGVHKNDKKRLWTISSSQIRHDHYAEVAQALSIYEQNLLPSSGGRSWEVSVQLSEPNARVLFRSWKGKMELACLPHLIDRIPVPPIWPGKRNQPADDYKAMQGEEEEESHNKGRKRKTTKLDYIKGLADRDMSVQSQVAYDVLRLQYDYPAPSISIKWKSPDAKTFTSRKTAWEHATFLSHQEVKIDRNLLGIGASGKLLKEFYPSAKIALEVGKLRFVRDGLWVVGQESNWQADREEELLIQEEEREEAAATKVYTSGLQLYVAEHRHAYKKENGTTLTEADKALRQQWRCLAPKEQEVWNDKVQEQFEYDESSVEEEETSQNVDADKDGNAASEDGNNETGGDESSVEYISPYQYFVQKRRHDYRYQQQLKLLEASSKEKFTLAQADKELRQQWKEMEEEEQDAWIEKLEKLEEKETEPNQEAPQPEDPACEKKIEVEETKKGDEPAKKTEADKDNARKEDTIATPADTTATQADTTAVLADTIATPSVPTSAPDQEMNGGEPNQTSAKTDAIFEEEKKTDEDDILAKVSETHSEIDSRMDLSETVDSSTVEETGPEEPLSSTPVVKRKPTKKATPAKKTTNQRKKPPATTKTAKYCLKPAQIQMCHEACMEHYDSVMRTVKTRDLSRELADGFDVLRERGHGRFDMELPAFDTSRFSFLTDFKNTPWMPIVRAILGDDVVLIHKGCFMSLPGAGSQVYHQDGVHLTTQTQRPCHAINVFVPLVDLHSRNGPTEFVLGSHVLGHDGYDRDFLETPKPTAGTPVIFDYRLGHRGLANSSGSCRPIVYCTYARAADGKEFRDSVNFSRKRYHKIGELSAKPLSREERRNKRKRSIETAMEKEAIEQLEMMTDSPPKEESTETGPEQAEPMTDSPPNEEPIDTGSNQAEPNRWSTPSKPGPMTLNRWPNLLQKQNPPKPDLNKPNR